MIGDMYPTPILEAPLPMKFASLRITKTGKEIVAAAQARVIEIAASIEERKKRVADVLEREKTPLTVDELIERLSARSPGGRRRIGAMTDDARTALMEIRLISFERMLAEEIEFISYQLTADDHRHELNYRDAYMLFQRYRTPEARIPYLPDEAYVPPGYGVASPFAMEPQDLAPATLASLA